MDYNKAVVILPDSVGGQPFKNRFSFDLTKNTSIDLIKFWVYFCIDVDWF